LYSLQHLGAGVVGLVIAGLEGRGKWGVVASSDVSKSGSGAPTVRLEFEVLREASQVDRVQLVLLDRVSHGMSIIAKSDGV